MKTINYVPNVPDNNGWKIRHLAAIRIDGKGKPVEQALAKMIRGWLEYAEAHEETYESRIGDDYVLGDEWFAIGEALLGLLNGDLGRMDGGTLDAIIRDNLEEQGFDCDLGERKK